MKLKWLWRKIKLIILFIFILQLLYIILLRWVYPPVTITQLNSLVSGNGLKRDYVSEDKISPNLRLAVIASEDQLFADHSGFDWKNIKKAIEYNEKKPGRIRGGSTISQQVAKNVFLWQGRSWFRKGLEMYFTKMIEWIWGKKRILNVYLNVIETGDGIFGVEAASHYYFDKSANALTKKEAAIIAAVLPSPKKYKAKPPSTYVSSRANWIVRQMKVLEKDADIKTIIR